MQENKVDLSQQQIMEAANAGVQLLNTPGAVNVPGPMAVSGIVRTLNAILTAIANGEVMLISPPIPSKEGDKTPSDDDEKKPDLKSVEGGKEK